MKTLRDDLIDAMQGEGEVTASLPEGCHAIHGIHAITGKKGYIVMPDELTVEEWEARQCIPQKD